MNKLLYEDVYNSTIKYFKGDELAATTWINKYSLKDFDNNYYELNPNDMHKRISLELERIESKYVNGLKFDEIFDLLKDFKYIIPQGSPMAGIGNNLQTVSLSNCFVVGNQADSYGGIFLTDQEQAQLMKRRGGVGHDLSHIRPKNTKVNNSALISTGLVPFMERYSNTTREVAQDGRRGALMLSCFAPDTFVLTDYGWDQIKNVIDKIKDGIDVKSWTHNGFKSIVDIQEFKNRDVYEIECENDKTIIVTPDHEFVVRNIKSDEEYLKAIIDVDVLNEELVFYF